MAKKMPGFFSHVLLEKGWRSALNYLYLQNFYNTRNPWLVKLLQRLAPYPRYIEIENTTTCGFRCIMCEHTYWKEPARSMSYNQFRETVDQFPRLRWIGLTGIGESYLNRDFSRMLRYCAQKRIWVEIFDLFYFVGEEQARELIELQTEQIWCSMDAATAETYNRIRVGADFDRVTENLCRFVWMKRAHGTFFPVLDFHFIINRDNIDEVVPYIELIAERYPGSKVMFTRMLHRYPQVDRLFIDVPEELAERARNRGRELGVPVIWNINASVDKPAMTGCTTWSMPFVFASGEVIPCCSANEANKREQQKTTSLGNVFHQSFPAIWWGESYRRFRRELRQGKVPEACQDCCLYHRASGENS